MSLPQGRLHSYGVAAPERSGPALPISFDQHRHVSAGQRPGSWMAIAFRLAGPTDRGDLASAWHAVVARHGTLRSAFSLEPDGSLALREFTAEPGVWTEHPVDVDRQTRDVVREVLDRSCRSFAQPSHHLCVVEPDPDEADQRPVVVLGSDHAHVDMWSLLTLVRDLLTCLEDLQAGRAPGIDLPPAAPFAEHTQALLDRPDPTPPVRQRWAEILAAEGGVMPRFALPLGELDPMPEGVVEIRDVLDEAALAAFSQQADAQGVRMIALATSVLTTVNAELADQPLRAVFPVHSRYEARWQDACGWFITNAVIESEDPDPAACAAAVKEAIGLGSWPLARILEPYGGMPEAPGMFALSWLDARRLPVVLPPDTRVQFVSAAMRTDGVMIWFVVNDEGLHLRCRYPDTAEARTNVGRWLDAVEAGLRAMAGAG